MKTEISRNSHRPEKHYSGVYQQQGRMLTDADWNELVDILKGRLDDALRDVLGSRAGGVGGTPRHRALKVAKASNQVPLTIQKGFVYVDGHQAKANPDPTQYSSDRPLPEAFDYNRQLDFPTPPMLPSDCMVYADVWERTVTHLMDERIRDKGLHGADTCTRKQMLVQVKWCPMDVDPEQAVHNPAKGNAALTLMLLKKTAQPDPCDPCADTVEVDAKIGNYLFRVEVHDVKMDGNDPPEITLKWSSENGAEQFAAKAAANEMPSGFVDDKYVYEFFNETSEKHLGVHFSSQVNFPLREVLHAGYPASLPGGYDFVRRWDGYATYQWDALNETWHLQEGMSGGIELTEDGSGTGAEKVLKHESVELTLQMLNRVVGETVTSDNLTAGSLEINGKEITGAGASAKDKAAAINDADASVTAAAHTMLEGAAPSEIGEINAGHLRVNGEDIGPIPAADHLEHQADVVVQAINAKFSADADFSAVKTRAGTISISATDGRNIVIAVADTETAGRSGFEEGTHTHLGRITLVSPANSDIIIGGAQPERAGFATGTTPPVQFVAGDYWLAEVREIEHKAGDVILDNSPPHGIQHHYLTLGTVEGGVLQPNPETDRKYAFPPLTEMTRMFMAGGDGQEAMPGHELPQPIEVAVANGEWLVEGASVEFSLEAGAGKLSKTTPFTATASPVKVATDEYGIARCYWKLGTSTEKLNVKAILLGGDGHPLQHPPLYFKANASIAGQVAYTPLCPPDANHTAHQLLSKDASLPALGPDGYYTAKAVLDALLCKLKAKHLPYDAEPCQESDTVQSHLEIQPATTVHDVLDKLLCDFNAADLPIDKDDPDLCTKLGAAGIDTVQDALKSLCRIEKTGGCSVSVGENGGQHATLKDALDALADKDDISICLMPGDHIVTENLSILGKRSVKISGAGPSGSVIEALGRISIAAEEIQIKDLGVDVESFEDGVRLKGDSISADGCAFTRTALPEDIHLWSKNYKSSGKEYGEAVAVDVKGNMFVTGYFTGKVDFGDEIRTAVGEDLFVVKLDPKGDLVWVQSYISTSNEHGLGIAVDPKGEILVTGHFDGQVTFGPQTLDAEGIDLFILKLEPEEGAVVWARNFVSSSSDKGHAVAVDSEGGVLVTGHFKGVMDADGQGLTAEGTDLFVLKLEPRTGDVIWAHNYPSDGKEYGMDLAVDSKGYVFLTGYFDGKVAFGEFEYSAKDIDLFVIKLEPVKGEVIWAQHYQSEGMEHGTGITVDPAGSVILTGYFDGKVAFGAFELSADGIDLFVLKLEPVKGEVIWANNYPSIGLDHGMAIGADADSNVFVTGYFDGDAIFGDLNLKSSGQDIFVLKLDPDGKEIWVKQIGGAGNQRGLDIAVHPKEHVSVTGYFSGHADFQGHKLTAAGVDLFALMLESENGELVWARNFASVSAEQANAVAVDPDDNVLVTGHFNGAVDFGGHILEAVKTDLFALKLGADGKVIWAKNYPGSSHESASGIAADPKGNVLLTGWFTGTVDFDGHKLASKDAYDLFILKLSPDGAVLWVRHFPCRKPVKNNDSDIDVDADGNALVTGTFAETLDFDDHKLVSEGSSDLFVLKLSPAGDVLWAIDSQGTSEVAGNAIAVDADGNVLVTGDFNGKATFGQYTMTSVSVDVLTLKLNPEGEVIWARHFGHEGRDSGHAIAVDKAGDVLVTGRSDGSVTFDDFELTSVGTDLFILKLEQNEGHVMWARNYKGSGADMGHGVAVDATGHVLVTGHFQGELDFNGRLLSNSGDDVLAVKLNPEGRVVWADNFVTDGYGHGLGIAADRQGHVLITGIFDGSVNFGGGTLTSVGTDLFITKLAIPDAAPPLVEVRPTGDGKEADLNWHRNTMRMPPEGNPEADPRLRVEGLFDALAISGPTIAGNIENNRFSGKIVLLSDLPDDLVIDPEGTVVGVADSRKKPFDVHGALNIRSNELIKIESRIPLGALQNGILNNHGLALFGSMMITYNTFMQKGSSFFCIRMTMAGNQFSGADHHSDVAAFVLGAYGTFSDNFAHRNAMIQRVLTFRNQSSNDLNFQDLTGTIGNEELVLRNGEETPAGTVMAFAADQPPRGWMECDGRQINRKEYAALFDTIGVQFGAGNGLQTFNIPDLRGEFIRGWDRGGGVDPGRGFATLQSDQISDHSHSYERAVQRINIWGLSPGAGQLAQPLYDNQSGWVSSSPGPAGVETRPKNVALMYCIKY